MLGKAHPAMRKHRLSGWYPVLGWSIENLTTHLSFCHALGRSVVPFPSYRLVALVVAHHTKPLTGAGAFPSIRTLARKTGLSKTHVHRCIRWLAGAGWLSITANTGFGQGWRRHRYKLEIPDSAVKVKVSHSMGHVSRSTPYKHFNNCKEHQDGVEIDQKSAPKGSRKAWSAWNDVLDAIRRVGRYRVPELPTDVLTAIRKIGGWGRLCGSSEFDLAPGRALYQQFQRALA